MIKYPLTYNPILDYWNEIEQGRITVCDKIRQTYKKLVQDIENPDIYHYSAERANHIIEFAENFCKPSQGKSANATIELELWEKAMLATIFGFIDKNGNRRYREAILIVGKKNGKSLLASIVGLYLQIADGEQGPEIYAVATKRDQAKKIWLEAKNMVKKSPKLRKRIKPLVGELSSEDFNCGWFKPLASDTDTLDGLNVHGVLMDEIHQWKNGKPLYDIMADGVSAREQPLIFITSTAGTIREDIYDQKYEEAKRLIDNYFVEDGYKDDELIAFIYELDSREEWSDESCWIKANPGLGTIKNYQTLKNKVEKAKQNNALVKNLVCKEFNIRETSSEAWLTREQIINESKYDLKELKPRYCIGGLDLSSTTDLTCATILFKVKNDETIYIKQMYWLPEDILEQRSKQDKIPYDLWYEQGLLRLSEGNKINHKDVTKWFVEVQKELDIYIYKIGYDNWGSTYVTEELQANFGKNITEAVIQGAKTFSLPMKALAADLEKKRINYDNNPITRWNLMNASIKTDINGNIQLVKQTDVTKRIDGVASMLDAYIIYERYLESYNSLC